MKKTLMLVLLACLILGSCNKYDEGPSLSLRSKTHRLCGTWSLSEIYINNLLQPAGTPSSWEIKTNGSCTRTSTDAYSQAETTISGTWAFNNDKTIVDITWEIPSLSMTIIENWTVLRLKEKELWLEASLYGNIIQNRLTQ